MKRRRLSRDEAKLWRRATRDVAPLRPPLPGLPAGEPPSPPVGERRREEMTPVVSRAAPARKAPKPSAFAGGDPKLDRKARRGRLEIERTLDLHGMRQEAARRALGAFIVKASQQGLRCVLVITGKGSAGANDPYGDRAPRGIIRRRFREWIDEEPLRGLISRAAPAKPSDGGSGAFYVFLKGRRAARDSRD
ncbi:MAG: hypothetical protein GC153_01415 [Alphaproteobacteria bacterium]|nr:hypothetical protein [Alphaproteobacteria bacterium]